jgi:hypothetical protein
VSGLCRGSQTAVCSSSGLLPESQLRDELAVALDVVPREVIELAATLADHHQQPAPRVVVLLVLAQMLGQVVDALGQKRDLHLRRARVALVGGELLDHLRLCLGAQHVGEGSKPPLLGGGRQETPRGADVALHLCDEFLCRGEAPFIAQPLDEFEPQTRAVKLAGEVDQMCLHQ